MKPKIYRRTVFKTVKLAKYPNGTYACLIKFPKDTKTLNIVRAIPERKFHGKEWSIPLKLSNLKILIDAGFSLDEKLSNYYRKSLINKVEPIHPKGLKLSLREYQAIGVGFCELKNGRAIIGDEMGLGKTMQGIGFMQLHLKMRPAVVITTASLKYNWEKECKKWMSNCTPQIIEGRKEVPIVGDILILNYDILSNKTETRINSKGYEVEYEIPFSGWLDRLIKMKVPLVITDECHYYANDTASRTKAIKKLGKNVPFFIAMSGTVIENKPINIFNPAHIVEPDLFPNKLEFMINYCGAKKDMFGWHMAEPEDLDPDKLRELNVKLQSIMIRRLKKDVAKDLPPKTYSFVPLEIDNRKIYNDVLIDTSKYIMDAAEKEFTTDAEEFKQILIAGFNKFGRKYKISNIDIEDELNISKEDHISDKLESFNNAETIVRLNLLKQVTLQGKLRSSIEWIEDFLESGQKLVVFAHHRFVIDRLMQYFGKRAVKIDGSITSKKKRQENVDLFQESKKIRLIIISLAGAEGINLTAASNIALLEIPKNAGKLDQIIDRVHRIGQTAESVNAYFLLALDTIEENLAEKIDAKRKANMMVMDGINIDSDELLLELIKNEKCN
jgi:SWI/SNF-related matrix-associated actin-dependent regulator 1 of chromatin subfamily A